MKKYLVTIILLLIPYLSWAAPYTKYVSNSGRVTLCELYEGSNLHN